MLLSQSYLLCDGMDYSPPGSSVLGISQARILEWVAISFSRGSSQPRIKHGSPALQPDSFQSEPPGKSPRYCILIVWFHFLLVYCRHRGWCWMFMFIDFIFKIYLFFNWGIIALQNFVVFCQTSTWISHRYTYIPSLLNLPPICPHTPPFQADAEPLFEFPETYSKFPWAIYFTYGNVTFHITLSNISPSPPLSPLGKSVIYGLLTLCLEIFDTDLCSC